MVKPKPDGCESTFPCGDSQCNHRPEVGNPDCKSCHFQNPEPKPDEGLEEFFGLHHAELDAIMMDVLRQVVSIKDAEGQERVERIFKEIEATMNDDIKAYYKAWWQALKKKELK